MLFAKKNYREKKAPRYKTDYAKSQNPALIHIHSLYIRMTIAIEPIRLARPTDYFALESSILTYFATPSFSPSGVSPFGSAPGPGSGLFLGI